MHTASRCFRVLRTSGLRASRLVSRRAAGITVASGMVASTVVYGASAEAESKAPDFIDRLTEMLPFTKKQQPANQDTDLASTLEIQDDESSAATPIEKWFTSEELDDLQLLTLADVREHTTEDSMWVTYNGVVYDVTSFIEHHPGGKGLILTAGGYDLGHFFENYTACSPLFHPIPIYLYIHKPTFGLRVHTASKKAEGYLKGLAIGRLSPEEAIQARAETTPEAHVESRFRILGRSRTNMILVMASLPFWMGVRLAIRAINLLVPPLARYLTKLLPISVPGVGRAATIIPEVNGRKIRVAVIGGGIAGSGAAYTLAQSGFEVTLFEGRENLSGNARTHDWDIDGRIVKSCVSVTAWPPLLYKNYTALLNQIGVDTVPMPLSWFLNSKVPGLEGHLWAAEPAATEGSLRERFKEDFRRYGYVINFVRRVTDFLTLEWNPYAEPSMYTPQTGLGFLNPFNLFPLHHMCRLVGISQDWWDIVFTPHYTASFLTDKLDNMCAVVGPIIEAQIPLNPTPENSENPGGDCKLNTCVTWADAGRGIRDVFAKLTKDCTVRTNTRVLAVEVLESGLKRVTDEHNGVGDFDRVIFACPCNAVGNMSKGHNWLEENILATPEYADDHHPATGHMHAVMHTDSGIIAPEFRDELLRRGSNYVEITRKADGDINIENTYNFGVQTPGVKWLQDIPSTDRPPMLISHAMGEGKIIDPEKTTGVGNHARAHPLYSGWNIATMLSLRLIQGRNGIYYCSNWTTPGNCHDMSLLSGVVCAHAIGAVYPFAGNKEAEKDFGRLRGLMGI